MARHCKISQLPKTVREEVNRRLAGGQAGAPIVAWLNSQPEVEALLEPVFQGYPISEQNLSVWRRGGYVEWDVRQDVLGDADEIAEAGGDYEATGLGAGHFISCLKGRLASNLRLWDGTQQSSHLHNIQILQRLCTGFLRMRRSEQQDVRDALDLDRLEFAREKESRRRGAPPIPPESLKNSVSASLPPIPSETPAVQSSSSSYSSSSLESATPTTPAEPTVPPPASTPSIAQPPKLTRRPIPIPPPSANSSEPSAPHSEIPASGEPTLTNPSLQPNPPAQSSEPASCASPTSSTQSPAPTDPVPLEPEVLPSVPSAQSTLFGVPIKKLLERLTAPYDRYLPFAAARAEKAKAATTAPSESSVASSSSSSASPNDPPPPAASVPAKPSASVPAEPDRQIYRRPPPDPEWLRFAVAAITASWPEDPPPVEDENDPTLRYTL